MAPISVEVVDNLMDIKSAKIVTHIHREMALHIEYCKDFGVTEEEIESSEESQGIPAFHDIENGSDEMNSLHSIYEASYYKCVEKEII